MSRKRNQMFLERVRRGWTQEDLAERAGLKQTSISAYERGIFPEPKTIEALAGAFDVAESTIYEWLRTPTIEATEEPAPAEVAR